MTDRHAADSDAIRTAASRCCSSTIVIPAAHPSTAQRRRQSTTRATTSMSMSTTMTTTSRRIRALRGSAGSAERACPARRLSTLSARTVVVAIPSCLFWYVGCDALHQTLQIKNRVHKRVRCVECCCGSCGGGASSDCDCCGVACIFASSAFGEVAFRIIRCTSMNEGR